MTKLELPKETQDPEEMSKFLLYVSLLYQEVKIKLQTETKFLIRFD